MGYESLERDSLLTLGFVLKVFIKALSESTEEELKKQNVQQYKERAEKELKSIQAELEKWYGDRI